MELSFAPAPRPPNIALEDWMSWSWQLRHALKSLPHFEAAFDLNESEREGFKEAGGLFQVRTTPYYAALASRFDSKDPVRRILMPTGAEIHPGAQQMLDPLGERKNNPAPRIIHRYPDRALFLVTDTCSVYCRYCTRKHFTGGEQAFVRSVDYERAIAYIRGRTGLREVILSGGDPLTLSDAMLARVIEDLRAIPHVELIRVGTRMPVVCPMRVTPELVALMRPDRKKGRRQPVYLMTHFNHPRELTREAAEALELFVDAGIPVMNQLVLLNGVNNHPAIIQALSRRLLALRVKPYYAFQCDPSEGTDHLRISVEESLSIQRELWGRLSGLAMPSFSLDIPDGGGKAPLVPDFEVERTAGRRVYRGWDGVRGEYVDPDPAQSAQPSDVADYLEEWETLKRAKLSSLK